MNTGITVFLLEMREAEKNDSIKQRKSKTAVREENENVNRG